MTGKQLIEQILHLGGKTQLAYPVEPHSIYTAINRAIDEINKLFPRTDTLRILHFPIAPVVYKKGIVVHKGGQDIVINASGAKSLAFAVSGTGEAILSADDTTNTHTFTWKDKQTFELCRCIVAEKIGSKSGNITLTFMGDFIYLINDLSIYSELAGELEEDIEVYSNLKEYNLASVKYAGKSFGDLATPPRIEDAESGETCENAYYVLNGSKLGLPCDRPGIYAIQYRVKLQHVTADNEKDELGIDTELQNLIAPRAAYYLYMLVDDEAADRCLREYHDLYAQYRLIHKVRPQTQFNSTRKW